MADAGPANLIVNNLTATSLTVSGVPVAGTGDIRFNGTWIKNKDTGDIYISPQDGTTGIYFPSDTNSGGTAVNLFNTNTGTVTINSAGLVTTFDNTGGILMANQVRLANTSTKFLDILANEIQMNADGQTIYTLRLTPGNSQLNTGQFQIFDEGANTEQLNITNSAATFTPPVVANGGLTVGNGSTLTLQDGSTILGNYWQAAAGSVVYLEDYSQTQAVVVTGSDVEVYAGSNQWTFNQSGGLVFPNSTVQYTAYAGGLTVSSAVAQANLASTFAVTPASDTQLPLVAISGQDPNSWITGSNQFQPNQAGWYEISVAVNWDISSVNTDTGQVNTQIHVNGTSVTIFQNQINTIQALTQSGSVLVYLNGSTDYVTVTAYSSTSGTQNVNAGDATLFSAVLITTGSLNTDQLTNGSKSLVLESDGSVLIPSNTTNNFHIDAASNQYSLNTNDTIVFGSFSGHIIINDLYDGYMYDFLVGGGKVWLSGSTNPNWTPASTAPANIYTLSGWVQMEFASGYTFTNLATDASPRTYSVYAIRTRTSA